MGNKKIDQLLEKLLEIPKVLEKKHRLKAI